MGHFLCNRIQGVERCSIYPRHIPSHAPPPELEYTLWMTQKRVRFPLYMARWISRSKFLDVKYVIEKVSIRCFSHIHRYMKTEKPAVQRVSKVNEQTFCITQSRPSDADVRDRSSLFLSQESQRICFDSPWTLEPGVQIAW